MGLVQRAVEAAGISTLTLSPCWEYTRSAGVPRIAAIEHRFGRTLGRVGDAEGQLEVLRATLDALVAIERPGQVVHLPFRWKRPPPGAKRRSFAPAPIVGHLARRPWQVARFLRGDIPEPAGP